jgi:hypothetical protein
VRLPSLLEDGSDERFFLDLAVFWFDIDAGSFTPQRQNEA